MANWVVGTAWGPSTITTGFRLAYWNWETPVIPSSPNDGQVVHIWPGLQAGFGGGALLQPVTTFYGIGAGVWQCKGWYISSTGQVFYGSDVSAQATETVYGYAYIDTNSVWRIGFTGKSGSEVSTGDTIVPDAHIGAMLEASNSSGGYPLSTVNDYPANLYGYPTIRLTNCNLNGSLTPTAAFSAHTFYGSMGESASVLSNGSPASSSKITF